jgi:hypothetical protein
MFNILDVAGIGGFTSQAGFTCLIVIPVPARCRQSLIIVSFSALHVDLSQKLYYRLFCSETLHAIVNFS